MGSKTSRRAAGAAVLALATAVLAPGCSGGGGKSDYDRMMEAKEGAATSLKGSGAKVEEKQYPVGKGWVVDLHGLTITENLLKEVKQLGNVAELNLSGSSVTDEHLKVMHDLGLHTLLAKLDLSNTAVTDAGLGQLDGCIFLMELNLKGTKVSRPAVEQFKSRRQQDPKARIKNTNVVM